MDQQQNNPQLLQLTDPSLVKICRTRQIKKSKKNNKKSLPLANKLQVYENLPNQKYKQILNKNFEIEDPDDHREITKYNFLKNCQICQQYNQQNNLILCDRCEDGYHTFCLNPPLQSIPIQDWFCKQCEQDIVQFENLQKQIIPKSQVCFRCSKTNGTFNFYIDNQQNQMQLKTQEYQQAKISCMHCSNTFHISCLNQRINAVNCTECQKKIRKRCPKGYDKFYEYIKESITFSQQLKEIYDVLSFQKKIPPKKVSREKQIGLKVPVLLTNTYSIIKQESSLYYALQTQHMRFIDNQVYQKKLISKQSNNPDLQGHILYLHQKDEIVFRQFKRLSELGYFGPIQIQQDKTRGFYARSIQFIPIFTIIAQYVGEVMNSRKMLFKSQNDSIYSLLRTTRSKTSLDICPIKFGNISKFLCGINNTSKNKRFIENVKTMRFNYEGKVRILFFAKRNIQANEILSINYNGGEGFQEYPTDHFL